MPISKPKIKQALYHLKNSLVSLVGNRRYMTSIETLFKKVEELDLTPLELEALTLLSQNINQANHEKNNKPRFGIF